MLLVNIYNEFISPVIFSKGNVDSRVIKISKFKINVIIKEIIVTLEKCLLFSRKGSARK